MPAFRMSAAEAALRALTRCSALALLPPLLPVLPAQGNDLDARVRASLERARPPLLEHLRNAADGQAPPGLLALLCLASLHDGVSPDEKPLALALDRLARAELQQTYEESLRLMVMEIWPAYPDRASAAARDCKDLLTHRHEGAFGYMSLAPQWDLSNTQYAALGLRAAASIGVAVDRRVWMAMVDQVIDAQRSDGGFGYRIAGEGAHDAYPSMTAAGVAVLSICKQALVKPGRSMPELDRRLQRAWTWFEKHASALGDASVHWSYYFHYGFERAAILGDVEKVGGVDWYRAGASMLLAAQRPGGGWVSATDQGPGGELDGGRGRAVDTAFAILFLRRRFQKIAGPITVRVPLLGGLTATATEEDVRQCAAGLQQRGKSAMLDVLAALRDDLLPRRRAALLALRAITGQDFGIDAAKDAEHNCDGLRKAELWCLQNR